MADISITNFAFDDYRGTGSTAYLRFISNGDWTDADGDFHAAGSYTEITCTVNTVAHRIDEMSFSITPTNGAYINEEVTYCIKLYDANRKKSIEIADNVPVPPSLGASITFSQLLRNSFAAQPVRDIHTYSRTETNLQIQEQIANIVTPNASTSVTGMVRLSHAPASPTIPLVYSVTAPNISGSLTVYTSKFAGADIGARINAAMAALQLLGGKGTVAADEGGTITTMAIVESYCVLQLGAFTYVNGTGNTFFGCLMMKDNSTVNGCGWQTVLDEGATLSAYRFINVYASFNGGVAPFYTNQANNITISNLQCLGRITNPHDGGIRGFIELGNVHNAQVSNVWFNKCTGYGVAVGQLSTTGKFAQNVHITNCQFDHIASQNVAVINAKNVLIAHNTFTAIPLAELRIGQASVAIIDIEPNTGTDVLDHVRIINNTLNLQNAGVTTSGILYGRIIMATNGSIIGNQVIGNNGNNSNGIQVFLTTGIDVIANRVRFCALKGIALDGVTQAVFADNTAYAAGGGTVDDCTFDFTNVNNSVIRNNFGLFAPGGNPVRMGFKATCTSNRVESNQVEMIEHATGSTVTASDFINNKAIDLGTGVHGIIESANSLNNVYDSNTSNTLTLVGTPYRYFNHYYPASGVVASSDITRLTHLVGEGSAPAIAAGGAAGASPTVSVVGADLGGEITIACNNASGLDGTLATITFAMPYANVPAVVISPSNIAAANLVSGGGGAGVVFPSSISNTAFVLAVRDSALLVTTYKWSYIVIGR
jgi:hypothetical protein